MELITLSNLAGGAAEELFQSALLRALENIDDPNTDATTKRAITLTLTLEPDEERKSAHLVLKCSTKLAGVKGVSTTAILGIHEGQHAANEVLGPEEVFTKPGARPVLAPAAAEQEV